MTNQTYREHLQGRIDECEAILAAGNTGDPERPYFWRIQQEAIIDCSRRCLHELDEAEAKTGSVLVAR